ncbi:MAG: lytic murein transglycosylase [Alphaproteobacteria bacterium]|nr:lytic murein transglycosylase [Alphaproteobacteria bacterium]
MRATLLRLALATAVLASAPGHAADVDFSTWLKQFRTEAAERGIRADTLDRALAGIQPIPRVIELDRRQPETTLTFDQYIERVINDRRVDTGRQMLVTHKELLDKVSTRFRVQPRFIVALWAIETDFGRITGDFPIFAALATLAYDGRRSAFFRGELLNALRMVDRGLADPQRMRGSWAGAMGQSQFMPSSFLSYAIDYDGDGKPDLWGSLPDVFASIANYLSKSGWQGGETWGREVRLPPSVDRDQLDIKIDKTIAEWTALGVRRADGSELPGRGELMASIVQPAGARGPSYLVYANYKTIMRWNRSLYFATAVGQLADRLGGG